MTLLDWQSIEICRLSRGYMVTVATPFSTSGQKIAFTTIEELAAWLKAQGIQELRVEH